VTNVRRAGSRPYFEWESELRRHARLLAPLAPGHRDERVASIDCVGSPSILSRCSSVAHFARQYCQYRTFTTRTRRTYHPVHRVVRSRNPILRCSTKMTVCDLLPRIILYSIVFMVPCWLMSARETNMHCTP